MTRRTMCALVLAAAASAQEFERPDELLGVPIGRVHVGDSNGDGLADVFVNGIAGRFMAFGEAAGGLSDAVPAHALNAIPATAAVRAFADVTGDGRDDLILTVPLSAELLVAAAIDDGTFAAAVATTPLLAPISTFVVADVTGDGRQDLWVAESQGERATLLVSNGDGSFTVGTQVAIPKGPFGLAFGDVTGDGRRDLVSLSRGPSLGETIPAVAVATTTGYASAVPLSVPSAPIKDLRIADQNGDGVLDIGTIAVATPLSPPDQPLAFVYPGGSAVLAELPRAIPGGRADIWQFADVDADGLADLVMLDGLSSKVVVHRALGNETFATGRAFGASDFPLAALAVVDANNDGTLDVITASARGTVRISRGTGAGSFAPSVAALQPTAVSLLPVARVGDVDDDGLPDVVSVQSGDDGSTFELRRGLFGADFAPPERFVASRPVEDFALIDVDADGDLDVLAWAHEANAGTMTLLNDGGTFGDAIEQFLGLMYRVPAFGDVTGDGLVDVTVFPFNGTDDVLRLVGHGDGTFTPVALGPAPNVVVVADVANVDNIPPLDVVAFGPILAGDPAVVVVTGNGIAPAGFAVDIDPSSLVVGDLNGDGVTDTVTGRLGPGFEIRTGDGNGFYDVSGFVTDTMSVAGFALVDVDDDGDLDVIAAERGDPAEGDVGRVSTWINDGQADFEVGHVTVLEQAALDVALADFDDDGLLDALVTTASEVLALRNVKATWTPLGQSLAGTAGFSRLDGAGPLTSGGDVVLTVLGATPSAATTLVVGFSELAAGLAGGVLVPSPDVIVTGLVTDGLGELQIPATLPAGVPGDVEIFLQAWQVGPGGTSATTAVVGVTR